MIGAMQRAIGWIPPSIEDSLDNLIMAVGTSTFSKVQGKANVKPSSSTTRGEPSTSMAGSVTKLDLSDVPDIVTALLLIIEAAVEDTHKVYKREAHEISRWYKAEMRQLRQHCNGPCWPSGVFQAQAAAASSWRQALVCMHLPSVMKPTVLYLIWYTRHLATSWHCSSSKSHHNLRTISTLLCQSHMKSSSKIWVKVSSTSAQ